MMSDSLSFGLTPARAALSATTVAVLGLVMVGVVARMASREGTPLHGILSGIGLSPTLLFAVGVVLMLGIALVGARKALAAATLFTVVDEGLRVDGPAGCYLLAWDNIERVGSLFDQDLGIVVRDRNAVLSTHEGSPEQRERFERLIAGEPYQGWDFHYFRHELGMPVDRVLTLLEQARNPRVVVTPVGDGQNNA